MTATKKGSVTLYVQQGKKKRKICKVKVEQPKAKSTIKIKVGKSKKAKLKGTKQPVTYTISGNEIAKVSADGTVTGIKAGTTTLTAQVGSHSYNSTILVQ